MHLLGHNLPDHKLLRVALTSFYGLSHSLTPRLLARLKIPTETKVSELSESQIISLSAYLSSPSTTPKPDFTPLSTGIPSSSSSTSSSSSSTLTSTSTLTSSSTPTNLLSNSKLNPSKYAITDPLDDLKIETDLKRAMQADIAHQRQVGSYRGRRHAMGLPVRGQKTRNNAHTAGKLNRIDRRNYSSFTRSTGSVILDVTSGAFRR